MKSILRYKRGLAILNRVYEILEPVYVELRAMGYNHIDLTS